jgi:hypothetical protein
MIVDIELNETDEYTNFDLNKGQNVYDVVFKQFISFLSFKEKKIFLKEINSGQSFYRNSIICKYFDSDKGFENINIWYTLNGNSIHWITVSLYKNGFYYIKNSNKYDFMELREFCDADETWFFKCKDASVGIINKQISLVENTVNNIFDEIGEFGEFEKLLSEKFPEINNMDIKEFKKFIDEKGENDNG